MNKTFLQFIWENSRFDHRNLCTQYGEKIELIHPGTANENAGPDFNNATIQIGDNLWKGSIVIHVDGNDWYEMHHDSDEEFSNVILNVCFRNVKTISNGGGYRIPTLELNGKIPENLISYYEELQRSSSLLACEEQLVGIEEWNFHSIRDKLITERFEAQSAEIFGILDESKWNWDIAFLKILVRNFGGRPQSPNFVKLMEILNYPLLMNNRDSVFTIEAILFGQAGLLEGSFEDSYPNMLQATYADFKEAYDLESMEGKLWKCENKSSREYIPLRLSELAHLICQEESVFNYILEHAKPQSLLSDLNHSFYWDDHTGPEFLKSKTLIRPDNNFSNTIMINVVAPAVYAYGKSMSVQDICMHALDILKELEYEVNRKTKLFESIGLPCERAADSEAVNHLMNYYCINKKCLECPIGCQVMGDINLEYISSRKIEEYDYIYN